MSGAARQTYKLFVGNLPWTVSQNELFAFFSKFGPVSSTTIIFDHETGFSKGYGFVNFNDEPSLQKALKEKNHKLEGRVLNVQQQKTN